MTLKLSPLPVERVNWLRDKPIAHRGLHDVSRKILENTLAACAAAVDNGYNIEVDLQPSSDGVPMVFHDYTLDRLTRTSGEIRAKTSKALQSLAVEPGPDPIPSLTRLLELVNGKVGVVLELKGKPGNDDGFVKAVSKVLKDYDGPVVMMSFHHHLLREARSIAPHLPLGLTAEGGEERYDNHCAIAVETNVEFVSYELENLDCRFVEEFRQTGRPLICWTAKSHEDHVLGSRYADQPTFEGFLP